MSLLIYQKLLETINFGIKRNFGKKAWIVYPNKYFWDSSSEKGSEKKDIYRKEEKKKDRKEERKIEL